MGSNNEVNKTFTFEYNEIGKYKATPSMEPIFTFISHIKHEIDYMLDFDNKIEHLKEWINKINHEKLYEDNVLAVNKLKEYFQDNHTILPSRFIIMGLLSFFEVQNSLYLIYNYSLKNVKEVIDQHNKSRYEFINKYILNDRNKYYAQNKEKLSKIDSKHFKDFRNKMAHFFSTTGIIGITDSIKSENNKKIQQILEEKSINLILFSPKELQDLLYSAWDVFLSDISNDSLMDNSTFSNKISIVLDVLKENAAYIEIVTFESNN